MKCRGPEYLRIIYGPDYDAPDNLSRLRSRGLAHKRSLALVRSARLFVFRGPSRLADIPLALVYRRARSHAEGSLGAPGSSLELKGTPTPILSPDAPRSAHLHSMVYFRVVQSWEPESRESARSRFFPESCATRHDVVCGST